MGQTDKYPLVSMRLTPEEVEQLKGWARRYRYVSKRGPEPGGLARDLFRAVVPLLEACDFDVDEVEARIASFGPRQKRGKSAV